MSNLKITRDMATKDFLFNELMSRKFSRIFVCCDDNYELFLSVIHYNQKQFKKNIKKNCSKLGIHSVYINTREYRNLSGEHKKDYVVGYYRDLHGRLTSHQMIFTDTKYKPGIDKMVKIIHVE